MSVVAGLVILLVGGYFLYQSQKAVYVATAKRNICILELASTRDTVAGLYTIAGIPEDKTLTATDESLEMSCACIVEQAGDADFGAYLGAEANKPAMEECSRASAEKVIEKYAVKPE